MLAFSKQMCGAAKRERENKFLKEEDERLKQELEELIEMKKVSKGEVSIQKKVTLVVFSVFTTYLRVRLIQVQKGKKRTEVKCFHLFN